EGRGESVLGAGVARVLEVVLDSVERRFRLRVLELEARNDERALPLRVQDEGDRTLGGGEGEARVVEDVVGVEEDDARKTVVSSSREERVTARTVFLRTDRDRGPHPAEPM